MKQIVIISAVLIVITAAIIGCLYIFGMVGADSALSNLGMITAAIVLLGGASAIIALLTGKGK